jgi:hypothetical protein
MTIISPSALRDGGDSNGNFAGRDGASTGNFVDGDGCSSGN